MPRRQPLSTFVQHHPPIEPMTRASAQLLDAYAGRVPDSVLALWRAHGLGRYGASGLRLVDPREWQAVLDRWIVSPPDDAQRVPIALTPFGCLVYWRKLGPSDEDVASIDRTRARPRCWRGRSMTSSTRCCATAKRSTC